MVKRVLRRQEKDDVESLYRPDGTYLQVTHPVLTLL